MQNSGPLEKPLGNWENIFQIMTRYGYVYNPVVRKWFNHDLKTAWTMAMLMEEFLSEVEFEVHAKKIKADPSFIRFLQSQLAPLLDLTLDENLSGSRVSN